MSNTDRNLEIQLRDLEHLLGQNEQAQNFREPTMLKDVPSFSSHRTTYMPERAAQALEWLKK